MKLARSPACCATSLTAFLNNHPWADARRHTGSWREVDLDLARAVLDVRRDDVDAGGDERVKEPGDEVLVEVIADGPEDLDALECRPVRGRVHQVALVLEAAAQGVSELLQPLELAPGEVP